MINSSRGDGALRRDSFDSGRRRKYQLSYNQWKKSSLIPSKRQDREHLGKDPWAENLCRPLGLSFLLLGVGGEEGTKQKEGTKVDDGTH